MKKIYNYIMICMLAFVAVSCSDEETDTQLNPVKSGDEVQFGLSLGNSARTVYGDINATGTAYPIYWVNGDKVQIFSPECLEGRRNAEYEVSVEEGATEQNYASALTKTGEIGVQWGNSTTANFYSLYPSGEYTLSSDGTKAEGITINYTQTIEVNGSTVKSDMEDCLMYAKKYVDTTSDTYEGVVELQYNPISTVVMVKLNVPSESVDDFVVQSISLTANTNIAGTFSLNIENGTFGTWNTTSGAADETVTAQIIDKTTGGFYTLVKGNSIEIPLFLAPVSGLNTNGWKIKVVANQKEYVKTLGSQDIKEGKIHKVTLPNLSTEKVEDWDVATWMKYIPRNVYLSEVSIPGTWNSLNPDFQTYQSISTQYSKGVRAFHLDTRWQREWSWSELSYNYTLGVANGGSTEGGSTDKYDNDSPTFTSCIDEVLGKVSDDEYMVLICSFAQNSADASGTNGKWYAEISAICNTKADVYDAKNLTPNTLVGDVLGKVIVIVNMPEEISTSTVLPADSKCLFTYLPSELTANHFNGTDDNKDALWVYNTESSSKDSQITIYNNQAQITSTTESGISTNVRGYAPTLSERTSVLNKITDWSKNNYGTENYAHDQWIYLGLGGYQVSAAGASAVSGSYLTIETTYNSWINDKVEAMGQNSVPYYPVGIVLMNNINGDTAYSGKTNAEGNSYNFADVVKNILLLNNKYRLQYDATKPVDYNPNTTPATQSAYDSYSTYGGDVIELN